MQHDRPLLVGMGPPPHLAIADARHANENVGRAKMCSYLEHQT